MAYNDGFSEFEIKDSRLKFSGTENFVPIGCVGTAEEQMTTKKITKKCEGVTVKDVRKGDGTGTLKLTMHIRYPVFVKAFGMKLPKLKKGVYSYGSQSRHPEAVFTCRTLDEEGEEKLKAYPCVKFDEFIARKTENGAEDVAEIEATLSITPDDNGQGVYEALVSEVESTEIINKWLDNFTPELVYADEV
ncbi:MAG: hypothetical protein NC397_09300 [Clostridium sp.]|nr:hypothetical protein [Clostridium sp.]